MIALDEDSLICDFAEFYGIYNYKSLSCKTVAAFSCGLRSNSRIKMKMSGMNVTPEQMMLASITDRLGLLLWMSSKDGSKGRNKPKSLLNELFNAKEMKKDDIQTFCSGNDCEDEWKRIAGRGRMEWRQN